MQTVGLMNMHEALALRLSPQRLLEQNLPGRKAAHPSILLPLWRKSVDGWPHFLCLQGWSSVPARCTEALWTLPCPLSHPILVDKP